MVSRSFSLIAFAKLQSEGCKTILTCKPHPDPEAPPSKFSPVLYLSLFSSRSEAISHLFHSHQTHFTEQINLLLVVRLVRS